jgi:ubiquinone/menaquinone biosynthesis C-methylase UbiE
MTKILDKNINDAEHYNAYWSKRNFDIDDTESIRTDALLKGFNGGKFIDLGCGATVCCQVAIQKSSDVWGLDISDKLIESLRNRFPAINYIVGDVCDLPFKDNFFDYMVAGELLEHVENPNETIKEIVRTLKSGGTLSLSVPNNDMGGYAADWHVWNFTKEELEELLRPYGEVEITCLIEDYRGYRHLIARLTKK